LNSGDTFGFSLAFNTGFALSFVTAMFVMFYIKERVSRAKLLQFVSGVNKVVFWLTSFIIDYAQFMLISLIFILTLAAYQKEGYKTIEELERNFIVLVIFGFSVLPYTYLWSLLFEIPSSGLVRLSIGYIVSGNFTFLAYFILNNELLGLQWLSKPLGWLFLIFPHYSLARGMSNLNNFQSKLKTCEQQCGFLPQCAEIGIKGICNKSDLNCGNMTNLVEQFMCPLKNSCCGKSFYSFNGDGIGINLLAMTLIGTISFIILFAVEYQWLQNLIKCWNIDER
jgi:ATP-binding cassette, subfamily A (ABC1), member 3